MGKLFLRLYLLLVFTFAIFFAGINNLEHILKGTLEETYGDLSKGTLHLIDKRLAAAPHEQWPDLIESLNKEGGYRLRLQKLNEIELPDETLARLNEDRMVFQNIFGAHYGYKRVRDSNLVLEFPFNQSEYRHNQHVSSSTFKLLELELIDYPQAVWNERITEISKQFTFPVSLQRLDDVSLSGRPNLDLINEKITWHKIDGEEYIYRLIKDSSYVLKLGPFDDPVTLDYLESILLTCLAFIVAIAVLFWVYPLSRDLNRLGVSANEFGQGDFDTRVVVAKRSPLSQLATTFNAMADRIQNLISSHKELTNAASHELRTPIARLRFGMEMMQTAIDTSERERFIKGMNADIDELDNLVAEILTYARFDRDRPEMAFQRQDVSTWLEEIVNQAKRNMESVSLSYNVEGIKDKYAKFEPKLMARAVNNLLQNARRYAKSKVEIAVSIDEETFSVYVDDDGPGIPEKERQSVFDAFKRLDASRDRDTGGFGLGLAIVDRIAQWHNGTITVTDSPLGGARFIISWPV
ncbi:MAG: HAMP domain-containing protein [Gammaproteobacteria bacterium]|nr:HAMP domain-containing protein [Gammaproteobacteria bacterium]